LYKVEFSLLLPGALVQVVGVRVPSQAPSADYFRLLGSDQDGAMAKSHRIVVSDRAHRREDAVEDVFRIVGDMVCDAVRRLGGDDEDGRIVGREALLDMVRRPRALGLVLGDRVGVFAGMTQGRLVEIARPGA